MEEGQAHIQLKKTDARLDAIIVGDPARIDQVAKFLTDVKLKIQSRISLNLWNL